jgi:hypothetical protein
MAAAPDSLSKAFSGLMIGLNEVGTIDMKETLRNFPIQLTSLREYARQSLSMAASPKFRDVNSRRQYVYSSHFGTNP